MKKAISLLLVFMLVLSFTACSKNTSNQPVESSTTDDTAVTDTKNTENTEAPKITENNESTENENEEHQQQDSEKKDNIEKPEENIKQESKEPEAPKPNDKAPEKINPKEAEKTVTDYVNKNGKSLEEKAEALFFEKTGMNCNCSMKASGTKLVLQCNINGFDDLVDSDKTKIKILAGSIKSMLKTEFEAFTEEVPEVTGADIMICEQDGDLITTVSI